MIEITGVGSKAIQMFSALDREILSGAPDVAKVFGEDGVAFHVCCSSSRLTLRAADPQASHQIASAICRLPGARRAGC
jgi:hypothetical protein